MGLRNDEVEWVSEMDFNAPNFQAHVETETYQAMDALAGAKGSISEEVRVRLVPHLVMIFGVWPLFSSFFAAAELRQLPYYAVPWAEAAWGSFVGILLLAQDFLIVGVVSIMASLTIFSALAACLASPIKNNRKKSTNYRSKMIQLPLLINKLSIIS